MRDMLDDALDKMRQGTTSLSEVAALAAGRAPA
jgi:hypothetical protein